MTMNNKVMTKIAELNAKNEREKVDIDKLFLSTQIKDVYIYELTKFYDKDIPFTYNSNENTINVIGVANEINTKFYMESEDEELYVPDAAQIELSDVKSVIGYIKEDLDWEKKSYILVPKPFNENNSLKRVYAITLSKIYDEYNIPNARRVEVKNIVSAYKENRKNRLILKNTLDIKDYFKKEYPNKKVDILSRKVKNIEINFPNNGAGLCGMNVFNGRKTIDYVSENTQVGVPIIPTQVTGKDVDIYSPTFNQQTNDVLKLMKYTDDMYLFILSMAARLDVPLYNLLCNILSIGQMMVKGFEGVKEEGFAPGQPHTPIKPSAGWFWKTKLDGKDPKAAAAVIQNYINNAITLIENGECYTRDITTPNPYGVIATNSVKLDETHYKFFYAMLNAFSPQLFSNYSFNYGGTFDGGSVFPITLGFAASAFSKPANGSQMLKLTSDNIKVINNLIDKKFIFQNNASGSQMSKIDTFWNDTRDTTVKSMGLYIIDFKYAKEILKATSANTNWRNFQAQMISSPNAVKIGTELDATFYNGCSWSSSKRLTPKVHIPLSVFENMDNPVFYHASTESEIDEQAFYNNTWRNHEQANNVGANYWRGYPKVPMFNEVRSALKDAKTPNLIYTCKLVSQFDDDAGSANDYSFGVQDFQWEVKDIHIDDTNKITRHFETGVNKVFTIGGDIPLHKPEKVIMPQDTAKTIGENTKNILNAPTVFIGFRTIKEYASVIWKSNNPFHAMSDMFGMFGMKYSMKNVSTNRDDSNLSAIELSYLGNDFLEVVVSVDFKIQLDNATINTVTKQFTLHTKSKTTTGIFDNQLFLEPSEDFIDTYVLLNLGDN